MNFLFDIKSVNIYNMKTIKQKKWMVYAAIGFYLMIAPPYMGLPSTTENAIYVVLGAILLWLSLDSDKEFSKSAEIRKEIK